MNVTPGTKAYLQMILKRLSAIVLDLYPLVSDQTIQSLNEISDMIGRLNANLNDHIPVFSDVNALAAALIRRRAADDQAWKELLDEESSQR